MRLDDEALAMYRTARRAFLSGDIGLAEAYYGDLRERHACELYYEVDLPEHVRLVHPVGTVLGRATYADYFVAYNCSGVGSDIDGNRPVFTGPCVLFPGARVLGNVRIGANVFITANTVVQNCEVPDNSVVFPADSRYAVAQCDSKPTKRNVVEAFFK